MIVKSACASALFLWLISFEPGFAAEAMTADITLQKTRIDVGKPIKLAPFSLLTVEIPVERQGSL